MSGPGGDRIRVSKVMPGVWQGQCSRRGGYGDKGFDIYRFGFTAKQAEEWTRRGVAAWWNRRADNYTVPLEGEGE